MDDITRKFGEVIRANRKSRGLSQEALAELADINRNHLSRVERGLSSPSIKMMKNLSDALGERLSSLVAQCEDEDG